MTQPFSDSLIARPLRLPIVGRDAELAALDEQLALTLRALSASCW